MTHKQWLDNEYQQWVSALQESTVHNFKEHPVVKRMLSLDTESRWLNSVAPLTQDQLRLVSRISGIGKHGFEIIEGADFRMVYYAQQILKLNPFSVCEIGGGVGQFYAILRALGYKGEYFIYDKPDVRNFQRKYLDEVSKQTGLNTLLNKSGVRLGYNAFMYEMVVSFYAIGEFDDEKKNEYFDYVINPTVHGFIAWNPHSGASDDLSLFKHDIKVTDGLEPGIKIITW
jgi:hypothetical protein